MYKCFVIREGDCIVMQRAPAQWYRLESSKLSLENQITDAILKHSMRSQITFPAHTHTHTTVSRW